jgi:hypothetical protein
MDASSTETRRLTCPAGAERRLRVAGDFGPQPPNIRSERYIPPRVLLRHRDLVVTHAGFSTLSRGRAARWGLYPGPEVLFEEGLDLVPGVHRLLLPECRH